ncbi:MAG: PIN domain nuclease [Bacillota bacterium]|nr:PIN domain nuclease [Bacillota bacterium]
MLRKVVRAFITVAGAIIGYGVFTLSQFVVTKTGHEEWIQFSSVQEVCIAALFVIIFSLIFFRLTPLLQKRSDVVAKGIESDLSKISTNELLTGTVGLITGLIIAYLISEIYVGINIPYIDVILNIVTYMVLGYIGIIVATRKNIDIRNFISARRSASGSKGRQKAEISPKILDTSVIIDGRISDIIRTGFIEGHIIVPEFVILELQHIADSSDSLKRQRGRRGLDIVKKMQAEYGIEVYPTEENQALLDIPEVDIKLLKLAQMTGGKVVTNDFNLNKVAVIKGVDVLNINELANTLKPVVLPGENMIVALIKEGKDKGQAVAYLDDGTMIVVENGVRFIGTTIKVSVTSVLQTSAGRMIFAKPAETGNR